MNGRVQGIGSGRIQRLGRVAPLPFVAVSAILGALILFTPVLFSVGPNILLAQGELYIDRLSAQNWTRLYVEPLDSQAVRYDNVSLDVGSGFVWTGTCPLVGAVPRWTNTTDHNTLATIANTTANPLLVYAEAVYSGVDGPVVFAGMFALDVTGYPGPNPQMVLVACTDVTPGVTVPSAIVPVSSLQLALSLGNFGSGGPP